MSPPLSLAVTHRVWSAWRKTSLSSSQISLMDPPSCRLLALVGWNILEKSISSPNALGTHLKSMWLASSRPLLTFAALPGCLFPDRAQRRKPGSHEWAGPRLACTETGRGFEGDSWLLDETRQSPGPSGVLCSRFLLNHWLHRCVRPTQASRGPVLATGSTVVGLPRVKQSGQSLP